MGRGLFFLETTPHLQPLMPLLLSHSHVGTTAARSPPPPRARQGPARPRTWKSGSLFLDSSLILASSPPTPTSSFYLLLPNDLTVTLP